MRKKKKKRKEGLAPRRCRARLSLWLTSPSAAAHLASPPTSHPATARTSPPAAAAVASRAAADLAFHCRRTRILHRRRRPRPSPPPPQPRLPPPRSHLASPPTSPLPTATADLTFRFRCSRRRPHLPPPPLLPLNPWLSLTHGEGVKRPASGARPARSGAQAAASEQITRIPPSSI